MADIKSNKAYGYNNTTPKPNYKGVPYNVQEQMNKENIKNKEQRLVEILGNDSLGRFATSDRLKQLAQNNPGEYDELVRTASELNEYYNKDKGATAKYFGTLGNFLDVGAADSKQALAKRIISMTSKNPANILNGTANNETGKVQQIAVKNYNDARSLVNYYNLTGSQILDNMHKLWNYFNYELEFYNSIPDIPSNQQAIQASYSRLNNYRNIYAKYLDEVNKIGNDPVKAYSFFTAYQAKPLVQLDDKSNAVLESIINDYALKAQRASAAQDINYTKQVNDKYNYFDKHSKKEGN